MKAGDLVKCASTGWIGMIIETDVSQFKDIRIVILDSRSHNPIGSIVQQATWQWEVLG